MLTTNALSITDDLIENRTHSSILFIRSQDERRWYKDI